MLLRWRRGMWRWLLVRMPCRRVVARRMPAMVRWLLPTGLRVRLVVWLRMLRRLVMLLVVRRCRRGLLTLVRLVRLIVLVRRRCRRLLLARLLRRRLVMLLRLLVLVMARCRLRMLRLVALRRLLWMLAVRSRRRLVWIRSCRTPPACWRLSLRMMWRLLRLLGPVRSRRGIRP